MSTNIVVIYYEDLVNDELAEFFKFVSVKPMTVKVFNSYFAQERRFMDN